METIYSSEISGEYLQAEVPLSSRRELGDLRSELGLPSHLALDDAQVGRFLGIAWAARNAPALASEDPALGRQDKPIPVAAFGSVAIRVLSSSANASGGPFKRRLGDLDLITTRSDGPRLVKLLVGLGDQLGSRYWHAVTKSDEMFNALRRGKRFRVHGAEEQADGAVGTCVLDLLCDKIEFCHNIAVDDALADPTRTLYTVNATNLLLAKLQAIQLIDADQLDDRFAYRVVGDIGGRPLIGPEAKDLLDASALLADLNEIESRGLFDRDAFGRQAAADWGLAKTVALNLANSRMFETVLRQKDAEDSVINTVLANVAGLHELLADPRYQARKPRMKFKKTWWEQVEDHDHD